jgi:hypothetical protein
VVWLLTGVDAYDILALGRGRTTDAAGVLLMDLANARLGTPRHDRGALRARFVTQRVAALS